MVPSNADLLEALADCLEGRDEKEALAMLGGAGRVSSAWARAIEKTLETGGSLPFALERSRALRKDEAAWLRSVGARATPKALRCLATRRRVSRARVHAILGGLGTPLLLLALTLAIDPLPSAVLGAPYLGPVLRMGFWFGIVALSLVAVWFLFGDARTSPPVLRICANVPFVHRLVRAHAEAELANVLGAFADDDAIPDPSLASAKSLVPWAAFEDRTEPFSLIILAGSAARALPSRLARFAEITANELTRSLRTLARTIAFLVLIAISIRSLVRIATRGLPTGANIPGLPSLDPNDAELKELDKIMKEGH